MDASKRNISLIGVSGVDHCKTNMAIYLRIMKGMDLFVEMTSLIILPSRQPSVLRSCSAQPSGLVLVRTTHVFPKNIESLSGSS